MAIEELQEPIRGEPSTKVLDWLNQQKCPEFNALTELRAKAQRERSVMPQINFWLENLRTDITKAHVVFQNEPTLKNFQAWADSAHASGAANSCYPDFAGVAATLGSRVFQSQTAKAVLIEALKKGISLLNQRLAHVEMIGKKAFLAGGLDWDSGQHQPVVSLRQHISKLRDGAEECELEMDNAKVGQMHSKYGGLLPLK